MPLRRSFLLRRCLPDRLSSLPICVPLGQMNGKHRRQFSPITSRSLSNLGVSGIEIAYVFAVSPARVAVVGYSQDGAKKTVA